jgi:phosphate-selective porin OprO/OprP
MDTATGKGSWRIWLLVAALAAAPTGVWAQDGQGAGPGYALSERTSANRTSNNVQQPALGQLAAAESGPEGRSPPPPPSETSYDDLARRVAELEQRLARSAEMEAAAKQKAASAPSVKAFGRVFWDTANFSQNPASITQAGDAYNGTEFRDARIGLRGEAFDIVDYKIEVDFAGQTSFKDVYVQVKELPLVQNIRAGHFYEAFGLEAQTPTYLTTFMEKSLIYQLGGVGGYKPGAMVFGSSENKRLFWQVGVNSSVTTDKPPITPFDSLTGNKDDFNGGLGNFGLYDDAGGYAGSMRIAGLLWYDEASQGRGFLQTGLSYSYRDIPELNPVNAQSRRYRLRAKPEAHLAPYVVSTPWLDDTDHVDALGPELLFVYGPFSVQAEYLWLWLDRTAHASAAFDGGYIYVSYFLTGENRVVGRDGILRPSRGKPFENFFRVRTEDGTIETGRGAWELAYRASYVNLTDAGIAGGRVVDHTFGVNWYLNPYTRLMFDYVHSEVTDRAPGGVGVLNAFMTRAEIDF